MKRLRRKRLDWKNPAQIWNDATMKAFLLQKMKLWPELSFSYNSCLSMPHFTYDYVLGELTLTVDRLINSSLLTSQTAVTMVTNSHPLMGHGAAIPPSM